ncbi:mechanosensitive ion channel family protein [Syntrophomonas curvata]
MLADYANQMTDLSIRVFNYENLQYAVMALLIFLTFLFLQKLFSCYLFKWLLKISQRTGHTLDDKLLLAFKRPIQALIIILGLYMALLYLPLPLAVDAFVHRLFRSSLVVILAWGFYDLTGNNSLLSEELKEKLNLDSMLIPFFSNVVRFVILALAIVIVAQEWNYDVNGFIAGLGLGGLAFALAAKDALANIFGGIVIIMEKPFVIGDWIAASSVEGTVENISFRSTKIRSFSQSLITIPNSMLAGEAITNHSRMGKRRINFYLGITYDTPRNKVESCIQRIKQMLVQHHGIHPETVLVYFEIFNESSLDIMIYCFTNTTVWAEYLEVKQDINLKIMEILEEEGVSIAFPSRTIYLEQDKLQ